MPKNSLKFRLKRGYCHVTKEQLLISRSEHIEDFTPKSGLSTMLSGIASELAVLILIAYLGYDNFKQQNMYGLGFMGIFFLLAAYRMVIFFLFSSENQIKREDITLIEYKQGIPYLTVPQFIVYYEKEGKLRKRLLPLASLLYGKSARKNALSVMKDSKLYKPGALNEDLLDSV